MKEMCFYCKYHDFCVDDYKTMQGKFKCINPKSKEHNNETQYDDNCDKFERRA